MQRRTKGKKSASTEAGVVSTGGRRHSSKQHAYFRSIPWDKWWNEFCTSREKTGRMTYLTAWQFIKAKTRKEQEQRILWRCVGPKPVNPPELGKRKQKPEGKLPYLGDWQMLRAKAYFYDNQTVESMKKVVTDRLDGIEAGKSSALVVLELIAKWMKYDDKIDEVFESSPVEPGLGLKMQEKRAKVFFQMKRQTLNAILELTDKYLGCHGIQHDGVNDLGALVLAASQSGAKAFVQGQVAGGVLGDPSPALNALVSAMQLKSQTFNLPLPQALVEEK